MCHFFAGSQRTELKKKIVTFAKQVMWPQTHIETKLEMSDTQTNRKDS